MLCESAWSRVVAVWSEPPPWQTHPGSRHYSKTNRESLKALSISWLYNTVLILCILSREIHPLDPQPHRHSILVPRVCAPRVTRCSLRKYWSRDWFHGNFSLTQGLWNQQAPILGVHRLSMTHSGVRQQNLMMYAQCPLPVYYSQILSNSHSKE